MTLLTKYILKGFLKIFFIIEFVMIWIFLIVDYLSNLDKFVESGLGFLPGIFFVFLKLPFVIVHLTPVSTILASVIYFGVMNKNMEVTALCSSGISIKKIYMPVIYLSIFLSLFVFIVSDIVMPASSAKLNYITLTKIKKRKIVTKQRSKIWLKDNEKIIYIDFFNADDNRIKNISINTFNEKKEIKSRIDAKDGHFKKNYWVLNDVHLVLDLNTDSGQRVEYLDEMKIKFNFTPTQLRESVKKPDEMGFFELNSYIKGLKDKGYDVVRYIVDFYTKTSFPFVCIIMAAIGSAIGLNTSTKKRIPLGVALSLGISFLYWSIYSFTVSLGYGDRLFPIAAAWSANLIFGFLVLNYLIFFERKLIEY